MLFSETGISAILDFDRNQFSFPLHDVGRILLSLAYHDGKMDAERIAVFRSGMGELKDAEIKNAFKLTAMIEIPWWIRPSCFLESRSKVRRFADEMLFLLRNISDFDI